MGYLFNYLQKQGRLPVVVNRHGGRKISYRELAVLARDLRIKGRSKMRKTELVQVLDKYFAANRIIIYDRRKKNTRENNDKEVTNIVNNTDESGNFIDPISLSSPIDKPYFDFETENGKIVRYSLENLTSYMSISKSFKDPLTGTEYPDATLEKIVALAKDNNIKCENFIEMKYSDQISDQRDHENLVAALQREAGSWIQPMSNIIQGVYPFETSQRGAIFFNRHIIPPFLHMFQQLIIVDAEAANIALTQWAEVLKGPPNRPLPDPYGYLKQALDWFEIVRREQVLPRLQN